MTHDNLRAVRALLMALGIVIAFGVTTPEAHAQVSKRQQAQQIFKKGQQLFEEGCYVEAGVEFLNAYQLDPHPAIMYNVARAHEEQGKIIKALQYYRVALGLKPSQAVVDELNRKIAELELVLRADGVDVLNLETASWVPKGKITIESEPSGAEVTINGQSAGRTPLKERVLPQGEYTVVIRRKGFRAEERTMTVVGGKRYMLNPRLRPGSDEDPALKVKPGMLDISAPEPGLNVFVDGEPVASTPVGLIEVRPGRHTVSVEGEGFPTFEKNVEVGSGETVRIAARRPGPIITEPQEEVFLSQTGWGWVVVSGGVGVMAFGGVMGALALSDASTYNDDRGSPERPFVRDDAVTKGIIADVSYGVGLALVVSGALMITFDEGGSEAPSGIYGEDLVWKLGPALLPGGVGVHTSATW